MASRPSKSTFTRCRELRESAALSMTTLAARAEVSRDLIRSLESGHPHSRHKVMAVFNALNKCHDGVLDSAEELAIVYN